MTNRTQLEQYRTQLYQSLERSADALMDLIDALASQSKARSVVELSLEEGFRRQYSSVYRAIAGFFEVSDPSQAKGERERQTRIWLRLIAGYIPYPQQGYWLFGADATSAPRRFARTLEDRGYVYQPNTLKGNKPVTIGHQYLTLACLPEKEAGDPPWIVPLVMRRVKTREKETEAAAELLPLVLADESLPWYGDWCVQAVDARYSSPEYLHAATQHDNLVVITRVRGNRTFYRPPLPVEGKRSPGHPPWYGEPFKLNQPDTWHEPDQVLEKPFTSHQGKSYRLRIESWEGMLMSGKRDLPMYDHPFTLVRITWLDEAGNPLHRRPMWLLVIGSRRLELSLEQIQVAYAQRYDLEHFFRFGKQRLLLTAYQTPKVAHEENWWQVAMLAYQQLFLARGLVEQMPRPWERYLPLSRSGSASPAAAQRGFGRIIRQLGSPAQLPKPRGNSPGRAKGSRLIPRIRSPVVKKTP